MALVGPAGNKRVMETALDGANGLPGLPVQKRVAQARRPDADIAKVTDVKAKRGNSSHAVVFALNGNPGLHGALARNPAAEVSKVENGSVPDMAVVLETVHKTSPATLSPAAPSGPNGQCAV
jgi:hypothetical protein